MKRTALCLLVSIVIGGWATAASAQADKKGAVKDEGAAAADTGAVGGDPDLSTDVDTTPELTEKPDTGAAAASKTVSANLSWQDIVVLPRKRFLKGGRVEFSPFTGVSVNDILIRHFVFGLDFNYFLTDALWVGLQGNYYIKNLTEQQSLLGLQYNRIATLNQYLYGGSLNFGYVPVYGKFALFNKNIVHWEIFISAGVGITKTEIIPRQVGADTFQTNALTPNAGIGGRFFLLDWLTVNWAVRDYILLDRYEPANRTADMSITEVAAAAEQKLVQNIMVYVGVGMYLPTKFQYQTPR